MTLQVHPNYRRLVEIARRSHEKGRKAEGITPEDIALARLYSYAFRRHTIGAFHATQVALRGITGGNLLTSAYRERGVELLIDLANRSMDAVGVDFRALISTFYYYAVNVERVVAVLNKACEASGLAAMEQARDRFIARMTEITGCNGIHTTQDTHAPEQASFIVPNLGITIVPLVYGDYHSWNLAYLGGPQSGVPFHRHHEGVEIHLGFGPLHGYTVLGDCYAEVNEGYAMPVPPMLRHGYVNDSAIVHHVPFIFGSLTRGGWGIFLDVEPQPIPLEKLRAVPVLSRQMNRTILLFREIERAAAKFGCVRYPIISSSATDPTSEKGGVGGLELSVARIDERGMMFRLDRFCIVSVVRGEGVIRMAGVEKEIGPRDHLGIPAGIPAFLQGKSLIPMITLDAIIKSSTP
jgi:hypothetical protein